MAQYFGPRTGTRPPTVSPINLLPSLGTRSPNLLPAEFRGLGLFRGRSGLGRSGRARSVTLPERELQQNRAPGPWSRYTQDFTGAFLTPPEFMKQIKAGLLTGSEDDYTDMAKSFTDWYREEYWPQASANKSVENGMYDFEFDPWTPDWEVGGSPYQAGLLEEADVVSADMQAWVASNDELIASTDRLWEVFSSPSAPPPAPVAAPVEDSGTDLEALMMAMAFGGGGNQPPSNPFSGFGTIYPGGGY